MMMKRKRNQSLIKRLVEERLRSNLFQINLDVILPSPKGKQVCPYHIFSYKYKHHLIHHLGIMKKAYELSTLTGTQVLLLVVSETGLVYTFTTAKLQPLVTQPEGKNLIQACLNAPHGSVPSSSLPLGTPINRSTGPITLPGNTSPPNNLPGGLSISGGQPSSVGGMKDDDGDPDSDEIAHTGRTASAGDKRRRRASSSTAATSSGANTRGGGGGSGGGGGTSTSGGGGGTGGGGSNPGGGGGHTSPHS